MNVFCDFHHAGLFYSLHLLFEKRLGANLYRPIGMDWVEQGFWKYYMHPVTQQQFLGLEQGSLKPKSRFNANQQEKNGIYYIPSVSEGFEHKAVTLDKFRSMNWDIIIASVPQHIEPYTRLASEFSPPPKVIFQMGNEFRPIPFEYARNILSSTAEFPVPDGVNAVFYHQEFDLDKFKYVPPPGNRKIKSYLHYQDKTLDAHLWYKYKAALPEFDFIQHGSGGADGVITGTDNLAKSMAGADFIWHSKPGGDGFGHIIHNAMACGRPVIGRFSHYKGKLAGELLEHPITGIDLDVGDVEAMANRIRYFSFPAPHFFMCAFAHAAFKRVVNFDLEFEKIKVFLDNLV